MDVEIGIQNVARPVRFTTKDSAESVAATLKEATDAVLVNGKAIGYAIVGEEEPRHVGFGM